jgi:hypothetical protein
MWGGAKGARPSVKQAMMTRPHGNSVNNFMNLSFYDSPYCQTSTTENTENILKNKALNAFSASLPLLLTSKALLHSHKTHIIHKRGFFSLCSLCLMWP